MEHPIFTKKISKIFLCFVLILTFSLMFLGFAEAGGGGKKGGSSPPPPPPPCQIQGAGCYKTGDSKAGFGELSTSDFAYYLPESKCIQGSCTCGSVSPNVAKETNPDDSSGACSCIAATDWNAKAKCCGDDTDDCGRISTGVLCSIDSNSESAQWLPSTSNLGDMRYVGCSGLEYLSDGNNWIKCEGTFWRRTVGNSEYLCIGKGRESIVECCGDGSCKSRVDGKRLTTGQSVNPSKYEGGTPASDSKTYYCAPDRRFLTDLDVPAAQIGDRTLIGKSASTCQKAGLAWTGTKCCSEDDDTNEFYNDPAGTGGCWNKEDAISVSFVEGTDNSVANFNGEFHGCAIDKTNFNTQNDELLSLADKHTNGALITNHDYCFNDPEKNYFCSYTERWLPTDGTDKTHVSFAPVQNPEQPADCCAADECWNGEACTENQKANPLAQPIGNNLRCIDGEWTNSMLKQSPDGSASGYCPKSSQCLLNVFGKDTGSQCLESGTYLDDNYCENGIWSTRTKLIALKLLDIKSGDFTLFCDSKENALNNLQHLTGSNEVIANTLANMKTNNFCVLKTGSKIMAATSINKNLEEVPANSLSIFGVTNCDDALVDDGEYHPCDSSNKAWFNKKLKSFIYSPSAISVPSGKETGFEEFLGNPIKGVILSIKRLVSSPPFDESYLKGIKKFDKIYVSQQGNKAITAAIDGTRFKNIVAEYRNFDTDICKFLDQYSQAKKDVSSGISCRKEGSNYYALVQGSQFTNINPEQIWQDLTSKLRLSGTSSGALSTASCFDGIKNQNEIGIDCGGACKACVSAQSICQNAQNGELCGGLDIAYTSGYKNTCCKEFKLCC
ncbi:hypothetical protein HYV80_00290 [Candidatus Woesearchaeota archaeon]|nr:hypothetical protein [Candidatus Woesearchaeota archaeon]